MLRLGPFCIFCGGSVPATSIEHCPPRALFEGRNWPEGFEFPACTRCNGGSSDEDLLVAFLSYMDPLAQTGSPQAGLGLFRAVRRQAPNVLRDMRISSAVEARRAARSLGLKPERGRTYQDLPLVKVPLALHAAVKTFAGKLTKASYFMQTAKVFPSTGGILFHWFTNASLLPSGRTPPALALLEQFSATEPQLKRNGVDLSSQFGLRLSIGEDGRLFIVQATFRRSFGFVCVASAEAGQVDEFLSQACMASGRESGPFEKL